MPFFQMGHLRHNLQGEFALKAVRNVSYLVPINLNEAVIVNELW